MMVQTEVNILDFLHFDNPTKEQVAVLQAMEKFVEAYNHEDFLILCGAAGTGKTSITSALVGYLNSKDVEYKIAAPTGRAARILGRKANTSTSTIHSLIYTPEAEEKSGKVTFKQKENKSDKRTIFIIDEASMIPSKADRGDSLFFAPNGLLFDLVTFVKNGNADNKIIFLGDQYQLPPVKEIESNALNKDFLEFTFNFKGSAHLLTEVKRQEDGSYILQNATDIRNSIDKGIEKMAIEGYKHRNIYAAADAYVREARREGDEESVAIGVSHKANSFFNDLVRERQFSRAKKILEKGDLLMVTSNWTRNEQKLHNGDHVKLLDVDWNLREEVAGLHFIAVKVQLLFTEAEEVIEDYALLDCLISLGGKVDPKLENELRKQRYIKNRQFRESKKPADDRYVGALRLMYGHAITCNKAQGGEWNKVYINTLGIPSLKWQYTAVTRGKQNIDKF